MSWVSKHEAMGRNVGQLKRQLDENCHERMLLLETVDKYKNQMQVRAKCTGASLCGHWSGVYIQQRTNE